MSNIGRRWWPARDQLRVFGAVDPSSEIGSAASSLADAVAATWTSVDALNQDASSPDALSTAVQKHAAARDAADELELLRRTGTT
jgi:hypothetical protein